MIIYSIDEEVKEIELKELDFNDECFYWMNLNPNELKEINQNVFCFDYETIKECESISQFAKVDFYDKYTFIVLNALKYDNGTVKPDEFNIYLSKNYIITVSKMMLRY